jgi:DNA repair protein RecO (recombination protein O)
MIAKTDAVILKAMKYRETSKIVTLYTRQFGKISAVAKGARGVKSKFGAALEPMSYVSVVLYRKENRALQYITQCDIIKPFLDLFNKIEKMSVGMCVVELMDAVMHNEEENPPMFRLLVETLDAVDSSRKNVQNLFLFFEIHLASLLGFKPNFANCIMCGERLSAEAASDFSVVIDLSQGGGICANCARGDSDRSTKVTLQAFRVLERLSRCRVDAVTNISLSDALRSEIADTLHQYLKYHVEGMRDLKSTEVFARIA